MNGIRTASSHGGFDLIRPDGVAPILAAAAVLVLAAISPARAGVNEVEAKALVAQLGGPSAADRDAAQKKLIALGADVVPIVAGFLDDKDLDLAARAQAVFYSFEWTKKGAIVLDMDKDAPARRAGLVETDIILRVDDAPVSGEAGLKAVPQNRARTLTVYRRGKVRQVRVEAGPLGVSCQDCALDAGGREASDGLSYYMDGQFAESVRILEKAVARGADDPSTLLFLALELEYLGEHAKALAFFKRLTDRYDGNYHDMIHGGRKLNVKDLPLESLVTANLMATEPVGTFEPMRDHLMAAWYSGGGANLEAARQLVARGWPAGAEKGDEYAAHFAHCFFLCEMRVCMNDRDYDKVIETFEKRHQCEESVAFAIGAAIEKGDVEKALAFALSAVEHVKAGQWPPTSQSIVAALEAAWLTGKGAAAGKVIAGIKQFGPLATEACFFRCSTYAFRQAFADPDLGPFLEETAAGSQKLLFRRLTQIVSEPGTTDATWREALKRYEKAPALGSALPQSKLSADIRFGRYAEARKYVEANMKEVAPAGRNSLLYGLDFMERSGPRLQSDWKAIQGAARVFPDQRHLGGQWVMRWDDTPAYIDPAGKLTIYPGTESFETGAMDFWTSPLVLMKTGTILARRGQVYYLDEKAGRWVPTFASRRFRDVEPAFWMNLASPAILEYVTTTYPTDRGGREVLCDGNAPGGLHYWCFGGGIAVVAGEKDLKVRDLGKEIQAAGKMDPAPRVYRLHVAGEWIVAPTDHGLWLIGKDGKLARAKLGLLDQDVSMTVLNWPAPPGKLFVGVAPQQGGQVFEMDLAKGTFRMTGAFCGLGPEDLYATECKWSVPRYNDYALMRLWKKQHP